MSIKKSRKSKQGKQGKNDFDINFRPIPSAVSNNQVLRGSKEVPKKLMPTTKLVGYTKEGAAIYAPVKTQNHTAANHTTSGSRKHSSTQKHRLVMG